MNEEWLMALKCLDLEGLLKLYRSQIEHEDLEEHIKHTEHEILTRYRGRSN